MQQLFVNKVLLELGHAHLFTYCLWLIRLCSPNQSPVPILSLLESQSFSVLSIDEEFKNGVFSSLHLT